MKASTKTIERLGELLLDNLIKKHGEDSEEVKTILQEYPDCEDDNGLPSSSDVRTTIANNGSGFEKWMRENPFGDDYKVGQATKILNSLYE